MKAYRIELLVLDHDGIGPNGVQQELENAHYGNRCISPQVMAVDERDIGPWDDSHPMNRTDTAKAEYARLFGAAALARKDALLRRAMEALDDIKTAHWEHWPWNDIEMVADTVEAIAAELKEQP
jgi:hypothetical protein